MDEPVIKWQDEEQGASGNVCLINEDYSSKHDKVNGLWMRG
jgi:hypothetical protein